MNLAKTLQQQNNRDLVELSVQSPDFHHRLAAAWFFGLTKEPTDCLVRLLADKHPLVSLAAHESCVLIAKSNYNEKVDFGPFENSAVSKTSSAELWATYFETKGKGKSKYDSIKNKKDNQTTK